MKDKILIFIIGLLIGAIITAFVFLVFNKVDKQNHKTPDINHMQMMERPEKGMPQERFDEKDETKKEMPSKDDATKQQNKEV